MSSIIEKPFDQEMQHTLGEITTTFHASELSKKDQSELPASIYVIEAEETMVGYGVIWEYASKGHAASFINWLKAKYPKKRVYVYTLDKSRNFWYKQDFEALGTTAWMTFN